MNYIVTVIVNNSIDSAYLFDNIDDAGRKIESLISVLFQRELSQKELDCLEESGEFAVEYFNFAINAVG